MTTTRSASRGGREGGRHGVDGLRAATATVVVLLVTLALALPVDAQRSGADAPPAVELILDASGSMNGDDGTGQPKIQAAKEALTRLVDGLPEGAPVGLRVYGHRVPNDDKANGCQDSELIAPVGPLSPSIMTERIAEFDARGFTPIGLSLQEAAKDLPSEGERTIILVSDGEDTCAPPDPCQVAADLAAGGVELRIETVGFQVDAVAADQLRCIAEATGGSYVDAPDAASLTEGLEDLSARALRSYVPVGSAVRGGNGPTCEGAPTIAPGRYTDSMRGGEERWYAVELAAGQGLAASGTLVMEGSVSRAASFDVEVFDSTGDKDERARDVLGGIKNVLTGGVVGDPFGQDEGELEPGEVDGRGVHCARLLTDNIDQDDGIFPVELLVQVEEGTSLSVDRPDEQDDTGGAGVGDGPDGEPDGAALLLLAIVGLVTFLVGALVAGFAPGRRSRGSAAVVALLGLCVLARPPVAEAQAPEPVEGGGSFNTAPLLEPGTYRDDIVAREFLYFAFDLQVGQRATLQGEAVHDGGPGGASFIGQFFDPLRNRISDTDAIRLSSNEPASVIRLEGEVVDPSESSGFTRPGRHYFSVGLGQSSEGLEDRTFPVSVSLQIEGEAATTTPTTSTREDERATGGDRLEQDPEGPAQGPELVVVAVVAIVGLVVGTVLGSVGRRRVVGRRTA